MDYAVLLQGKPGSGKEVIAQAIHEASHRRQKRSVATEKINTQRLKENSMRSALVFDAMTYVSNRFLLTLLAAKATRKLHKPNTRVQETANEVLVRFSRTNPIGI